ncbi:hypothetical protein C8034_v003212 [Colletotrichum sidae]|uniref:Uncharacterized protein n=1 Tax=Colletotrichum sidae TaxID=1347389 RepID=A0A4R8TAP6_9PEZI|nr:hypothetical protein C8034_v003212 [Colletotrichum sidae]
MRVASITLGLAAGLAAAQDLNLYCNAGWDFNSAYGGSCDSVSSRGYKNVFCCKVGTHPEGIFETLRGCVYPPKDGRAYIENCRDGGTVYCC